MYAFKKAFKKKLLQTSELHEKYVALSAAKL